MSHSRIYLDNNATTKIDPRVLEVVCKSLKNDFGNPSSIYQEGRWAKSILIQARDTIAQFLQVKPQEILFHSGATEGLGSLLRGFFLHQPGGEVITSTVEHASVQEVLEELNEQGICRVVYLSPGEWGAIQPEALNAAINSQTRLIMLLAANNETGVKIDLPAFSQVAESHSIPLILDGVAWLGKEPLSIPTGVSAICFSGHKIHAPRGIGFSFIRSKFKVSPLFKGGGQEQGRRGGTENLSAIVGLAKAISILQDELPEEIPRMARLRDRFEQELFHHLGRNQVEINGAGPRLVNTSNLAFKGVEGELLLTTLDLAGIAASHGAACSSGSLEPSRILLNMGLPAARVHSSLRFSLSRFTTDEEITRVLEVLIPLIRRYNLIFPSI